MPPGKRPGAPARKVARREYTPRIKAPPPPRAADPFAKKTGRRRTYYTAEFLAEAKRRVEQTSQSTTAIAGNFGMHQSVLARLIEREGWVRPENAGRRRGLSPVMRIAAAVDALAASPPPGGGSNRRPSAAVLGAKNADAEHRLSAQRPGGGESRSDQAHPTPDRPWRSDPPPAGEGNGVPVAPSSPDTSAIDRLEAAVLKELTTVETMRASLGSEPLRPMDAERTARTLSVLTETLAKLRRLRLGAQPQSDLTDDIPDIDAFRLDLARRIDLFVASRTDAADAGGDPAALALGEAG